MRTASDRSARLPRPGHRWRRRLKWAGLVVCVLIIGLAAANTRWNAAWITKPDAHGTQYYVLTGGARVSVGRSLTPRLAPMHSVFRGGFQLFWGFALYR